MLNTVSVCCVIMCTFCNYCTVIYLPHVLQLILVYCSENEPKLSKTFLASHSLSKIYIPVELEMFVPVKLVVIVLHQSITQ